MSNKQSTFIVYRRTATATVEAFEARLVKNYAGWSGGKPVGLPRVRVELLRPVSIAKLYEGHTAWIGEQIERQRAAIKAERARRAEKKIAPGASA